MPTTPLNPTILSFCGVDYLVDRPHPIGLVIERPVLQSVVELGFEPSDYLQQHLLGRIGREAFIDLVRQEGLLICRNLSGDDPSYRKVRGKSSAGRLSPAEYYHHDGTEGGRKARMVEIRLPYQEHPRTVATTIAPFPTVVAAMCQALPVRLQVDPDVVDFLAWIRGTCFWDFDRSKALNQKLESETSGPNTMLTGAAVAATDTDRMADRNHWEKIQGKITRLIRRDLDVESCRSYFREVDRMAGAFDLPWQMGESRLMLNDDVELALTMQHRRAMQHPKEENQRNGSLYKRWPIEEFHPTIARP